MFRRKELLKVPLSLRCSASEESCVCVCEHYLVDDGRSSLSVGICWQYMNDFV